MRLRKSILALATALALVAGPVLFLTTGTEATISTTTTAVRYNGDGSTASFAIPFEFPTNASIVVTLRSTTNVETTWTLDTEYSLSGAGDDAGGTLTVSTSPTDYTPASGTVLVIERIVPETQAKAFPSGGIIRSTEIESGLDLGVMGTQQGSREASRSMLVPTTDSQIGNLALPIDTARANKYLGFDGNGAPTVLDGTSGAPIDVSGNSVTITGGTSSATLATRFGRTISVVDDFGAACDGSTDDTDEIQAAIDALSSSGGRIYIPTGVCITSAALVLDGTVPLEFFGDCTGCTIIRSNAAAGHVIDITATPASVYLHDFTIDRTGAVTKAAATAGIHIDEGGGAGSVNQKTVERIRILNMYHGIWVEDATNLVLSGNVVLSFLNTGIFLDNEDAADHGWGRGLVQGNFIWDIAGTTGCTAGLRWSGGSGMRLHANRVLGACDYGLYILLDKTVTNHGALIVTDNLFERQELYGIYASRSAAAATAGTTISHIVISGNHFQALDSGYQNIISIVGSSPGSWVRALQIVGNVLQNSLSNLASDAVILITDGDDILVADNQIDHIGSGDGGIRSGGFATAPQFLDNVFDGGTEALRYPGSQVANTVIQAPQTHIPGARVFNIPMDGTALASVGTDAAMTAGTIYVAEVFLPAFKRATGLGCLNGTTVGTDSLIYAIYPSAGGAALATTALAGTTGAGADSFQEIAFTAIEPLPPGRYWVAVQANGTTHQTQRIASGTLRSLINTKSTAGSFGTISSLTIPTTFTADVGPICYIY